MTQKVSDEILGKFARKQADWFRRVRDGSLDPIQASRLMQSLIDKGSVPTGLPDVEYGDVIPNIPVRYRGPDTIRSYLEVEEFGFIDDHFTSGKFSHIRFDETGLESFVDIVLVCLKEFSSKQKVFDAMKAYSYGDSGLRFATLPELLALSHERPDLRSHEPLVAFGSNLRSRREQAYLQHVAHISTHSKERKPELRLESLNFSWPSGTRFVMAREYLR